MAKLSLYAAAGGRDDMWDFVDAVSKREPCNLTIAERDAWVKWTLYLMRVTDKLEDEMSNAEFSAHRAKVGNG